LLEVLLFGSAGWLAGGIDARPERAIVRTRRKGALRARLLLGSAFGLAFGLAYGLLAALTDRSRPGLMTGLLGMLGTGLPVGLGGVLVMVTTRFRTSQDASDEIRDDLVAGVVYGALASFGAGLATAASDLVAGVFTFPFTGYLAALGGICAALFFATASVRYGCAVLAFRRRRIFAARPAKFLQWAVRTGLVRVTGTAYQIRHDTYRQWLVTRSSAVEKVP